MTQKEIIEFEETNTGVIRLNLEGSFYKAYERSAFAFCTRIKDYRVLRKESKTLGRDILYVGFPMSALDKTLGNAMTRKVSDTALDVVLSYPMNENDFLQWRDSQEVEAGMAQLFDTLRSCGVIQISSVNGNVNSGRWDFKGSRRSCYALRINCWELNSAMIGLPGPVAGPTSSSIFSLPTATGLSVTSQNSLSSRCSLWKCYGFVVRKSGHCSVKPSKTNPPSKIA